jgi:hypothetical protein
MLMDWHWETLMDWHWETLKVMQMDLHLGLHWGMLTACWMG